MHPAEKFEFSNVRVGVVDSSKFSFTVLRNVLTGFGFRQIASYDSPEEAVHKITITPIDLLFLDPVGRVDRSFEAIRKLRHPMHGETSIAPFLVMTADVDLHMLSVARDVGVDFVVTKPFSAAVLLDRIIWSAKRPGRRNVVTQTSLLASKSSGAVEIW